MARWSFKWASWTPVPVADTIALTASGYMALQGGTTTQLVQIWEVYMGGQATSSAPAYMLVSRDSTVTGATLTALTTGQSAAALDPATAALAAPVAAFTGTSGTEGQRSATLGLLNLSFNAFGGIVRWAAPDEHGALKMLGNTASFGELSLTEFTGGSATALMGAHIIYEPL